MNQSSEACDGTDDAACPGRCRPDCTCAPAPTCGDNAVNQATESCDGSDDATCPGRCLPDCTCAPSPACGDNVVNQGTEACDGTDDAAERLERVLTSDPGLGVVRHADAGYERAVEVARERGVRLPSMDS